MSVADRGCGTATHRIAGGYCETYCGVAMLRDAMRCGRCGHPHWVIQALGDADPAKSPAARPHPKLVTTEFLQHQFAQHHSIHILTM
jgi:hypothetical protein